MAKTLVSLLDLCVSSLRRGHANLLCIVPILTDDLRGESNCVKKSYGLAHRPGPHLPQPSCNCRHHPIGTGSLANKCKQLVSLLDLCVSSLRRGHANLLCVVPILTDDPRRESKVWLRGAFLKKPLCFHRGSAFPCLTWRGFHVLKISFVRWKLLAIAVMVIVRARRWVVVVARRSPSVDALRRACSKTAA